MEIAEKHDHCRPFLAMILQVLLLFLIILLLDQYFLLNPSSESFWILLLDRHSSRALTT